MYMNICKLPPKGCYYNCISPSDMHSSSLYGFPSSLFM
uniref:Uncharacterized protein n=1 Tax=Rhizophora mucronata TaxID=61149 RepID=A0A2P2Q1R2_RHIMU